MNTQAQQQIQQLAAMTGQSEADMQGFLVCISHWIAKGLTFEQAIAKNLQTLQRFADGTHTVPRAAVVDAFFPA